MTPKEIAEEYLSAHNDYVSALKALLNDLDLAWRDNDRARCDLLCDAIIVLQSLGRDSEKSA